MGHNIRSARKAAGMTQQQLAEAVGVGVPQVSRWESGKVDIPTSRLIIIAKVLNANPFDLLPGQDPGPPPNAVVVKMEGPSMERLRDDLPLYGTALGAAREVDGAAIEQTTLNTGEILQYIRRPVILNENAAAYGLYVAGSSMDPRYRDGELLIVDPKGRIRAGEDVVVYLRPKNSEDDDGMAARAVLVKTLVRRASTYIELEQFSPAKIFRVEMDEVVRIDRVLPLNEVLG